MGMAVIMPDGWRRMPRLMILDASTTSRRSGTRLPTGLRLFSLQDMIACGPLEMGKHTRTNY